MRKVTALWLLAAIFLTACMSTVDDVVTVEMTTIPTAEATATAVATATATVAATPTLVPTDEPTATPEPTATVVYEAFSAELLATDDLHPSAPIVINFTQPVQNPDIASPISLRPSSIDGTVSWSNNNTTLTFQPSQPLPTGRIITVQLNDFLQGVDGGTIDSTRWTPRVMHGVTVLSRVPDQRELSDTRPTIRITFPVPMDESSVAEALTVEPNVPLSLEWDGNDLLLSPDEPLAFGGSYRFVIAKQAISHDGIPLASSYRWTQNITPAIEKVTGPDVQEPQRPLTIKFNFDMQWQMIRDGIEVINTATNRSVDGTLSIDETAREITFTPKDEWAIDTIFHVFGDGWQTADGVVLQLREPLSFASQPTIVRKSPTKSDTPPRNVVQITFDRPMDQTSVEAAFGITPTVEGNFSWDENKLIFTPETRHFANETTYEVVLTTDALSASGEPVLTEPYGWSFRTTVRQTSSSFGESAYSQAVEASGRRMVQFERRNVELDELQFALRSVSMSQLADVHAKWNNQWRRSLVNSDALPIVHEWRGDETGVELPDSTERYLSDLGEIGIPTDVAPGIYVLEMADGVLLNDQMVVNVTDLALVVKSAETPTGLDLAAWVSALDGQPIIGAAVNAYDGDGSLVASATSNGSGFAYFPDNLDSDVVFVTAQLGNDIVFSGTDRDWDSRGSDNWRFRWRSTQREDALAASVWTDRPIYRPGQTVYFKAIVRNDNDAIITLPPIDTLVTINIRDARNNLVQTQQYRTNQFGTVNGEFLLADGAMLGDYNVEIEALGGRLTQLFKVQDYRKPDYRVEVTASSNTLVQGQPVNVTVNSSYFYGPPVDNATVKLKTLYNSPGWYYNYNINRWRYQNSWYEMNSEQNGRTDAEGNLTHTFSTNNWDKGYRYRSYYYGSNVQRKQVLVEATVNDGSQQTVAGTTMVTIYSAGEILKLNTNGYLKQPGTTFSIKGSVVDIFDQPVAGRTVSVSLRRWSSSTRDYTMVLENWQGTTDANGEVEIDGLAADAGYYRIRGEMEDALGNVVMYKTSVYVFNRSYSSWYRGNSGVVNISVDKDSYTPGETAQVLIDTQLEGVALLTFERGTTRREQLVTLTPPLTIVEAQLQYDDAPNIYITANVWQHRDDFTEEEAQPTHHSVPDGRLHTARTNVVVAVVDKQLNVEISSDALTYAPRDSAEVTLQVTDENGNPVSAELSLAMVDEAIFSLSDDLSKPLFDGFYYERANEVATFDSYAPTRTFYAGGKGGGGGDGLGFGTNPRSDFPDTALWLPTVTTDANGMATISIDLPDSLTQWRITAKATTVDTKVGESSHWITTTQSVRVRPILPRTLTAGDQFNLSTLVQNSGSETVTLTVSFQDDPLLLATSPSTGSGRGNQPLTLTLAANEKQIVGWPMEALAAGEAVVWISAKSGDITLDAIRLPLTINPLAIPDYQTDIGNFTEQHASTVTLPPDALPMSTLTIRLDRSIAGTLLDGLDYLTGFPYGCVEQTMSRALPNAVIGRAFNQLGFATTDPELDAKVNAGLQKLYGFQHNDGGWGWWFDDASTAYQSAWVMFGLAATRDAGYQVSADVIRNGYFYLNANLDKMDARTRAYALYSMALAGVDESDIRENDYRAPDELADAVAVARALVADEFDKLDAFSLAALALSFDTWGETEDALQIVAQIEALATELESGRVFWDTGERDGGYHSKTMASETRSTALVLSALSKIRPESELIPGTVRWLMDARQRHGWGTTNETSYAILGLTDHLLATSFSENSFNDYAVEINGEVVAEGRLERGAVSAEITIPAADLVAGDNNIVLRQSGDTPIYYSIINRIYVAQEAIEAAGPVEVTRSYHGADGATVDRRGDTVIFQQGDLIKVQITVKNASDLDYVLVEDKLPAGLEALNENLNSDSFAPRAQTRYNELGYNRKEVHGDRVTFFVTEMLDGTHTFTYFARATRDGSFVAMPAYVEAMYDLTQWGRSASTAVVVENELTQQETGRYNTTVRYNPEIKGFDGTE